MTSQEFEILRQRTQETQEDLRLMEQEQEQFSLQYHDLIKSKNMLQVLQSQGQVEAYRKNEQSVQLQQNLLQQTVERLRLHRLSLLEKFQETIASIKFVQSEVLDKQLIKWKKRQQLGGNGALFENNIDQIQELCELLAEIIWSNRQQLKSLDILREKAPFQNDGAPDIQKHIDTVTSLLSTLVTGTFLVEKQPPQVMKTNTRFTSSVRLLVGAKLNVNMTPPQVKVTIISEAQALQLLQSEMDREKAPSRPNETSGEIINNSGTMEYSQSTRQLAVNFRNMQLKKIKRTEKRGSESVMDEKFSLLFQTQFNVGNGELEFFVWTLSLPVVVIVHGNQEPHAWATVSWDNAFSEFGRTPFVVPERVLWPRVAEMLNMKFTSGCSQSLTDENIIFLAGKAFRNHRITDFCQMPLSWNQFCKEPLPDRNFTFWEWFFGIFKLTREHLRNLWNEGLIMGFVGKKQAEAYLRSQHPGTFLLRFSDSELGGISIAALREGGVEHLSPWSSKDFTIRSLPDRIGDLEYLTYLFPNIPKHRAFERYYTPKGPQNDSRGYVKPELRTCVPDSGALSSSAPSPAAAGLAGNPGSVGSTSQQSTDGGICGGGEEGVDWEQLPDLENNEEVVINFLPIDWHQMK